MSNVATPWVPGHESRRRPHLSIRPPGRWSPLALAEIWRYRDLFVTLAARDVKLRYRQTALGITWVILQPLLAAAIFTFVFGRVARMPSDGIWVWDRRSAFNCKSAAAGPPIFRLPEAAAFRHIAKRVAAGGTICRNASPFCCRT